MWSLLLLLGGLAGQVAGSALPPSASSEIVLSERKAMVMMVISPRGADLKARTAEMLSIASEILERRTDLRLLSVEQAGTDRERLGRCPQEERLSCWVRSVRPDYERRGLQAENGQLLPYSEHQLRIKRKRLNYARYLVVLSTHPEAEDHDSLSAMLIDTDRVLALVHANRTDDPAELEARIFESLVQAPTTRARGGDLRDLRDYFRMTFEERFRPTFEAAGHWEPFGTIEIALDPAGIEIGIDAEIVGATRPEKTRISAVSPGRRKVTLIDPLGRYAPFAQDIEVERQHTATLTPALEASKSAGFNLRSVSWYGGLGLATAGAAFLALAWAASPATLEAVPCYGDRCQAPGPAFLSFCEIGAKAPGDCAGSVLIAPLGLSLLVLGGVYALGSSLLTEPGEEPWLWLAVGTLLGAGTYALAGTLGSGP